jgi:hypothetical protein
VGKTYKDNAKGGYDKRDKYEKRNNDRNRKKMNIDPGDFWDRNKKFKKNNVEDGQNYEL